MGDENLEDEGKKEDSAHVWARDGEGPHGIVPPPKPYLDIPATADKRKSMADLQDLVAMAGAAQDTSTDGAKVDSKGPGEARSQQAAPGDLSKTSAGGAGQGKRGADRDGEEDDGEAVEDEEEGEEAEGGAAPKSEKREGEGAKVAEPADNEMIAEVTVADGSLSKNDIAIGYVIPLAIFFVGYLINMFVCGYCLDSERMNALFEIFFFSVPALAALCLLVGQRLFKIIGAVLFLPLAGAAVYGCIYFHSFERFSKEVGQYGILENAYDANGWRICRYESSWIDGNMPGTTYTREKDAAPFIRYVRKMRIGEPP